MHPHDDFAILGSAMRQSLPVNYHKTGRTVSTQLMQLLPAILPLVLFLGAPVAAAQSPKAPLAWPAITREARPWAYWWWMGSAVEIAGEWNLKFIQGGPALPPELRTTKLASWTELGGEEAQRFAGTAKYSITFDAPRSESRLQAASGDARPLKRELQTWHLDLGKVCQSARVRLNGRDLGTLLTPPFSVTVDELKPRGNLLEVEVTNVSANRIRDLDRRGVNWKNFHDINFVNQDYRPFDASNWLLFDSGLLGPVTLTAMEKMQPASPTAR